MMKKAIWIGMIVTLVGLVSAPAAWADDTNHKTVLTFSQPVEIPGHVLPAGTYVFKLTNLMSDRHIVQVFNADESQMLATLISLSDYRLISTDQTVIKFTEVPAGSPEAIRAWFYPGNTIGEEFVYPKKRAAQLAMASKTVVPAIAIDAASVEDLKKVPIVAVTPEQKETEVASAIQTTPAAIQTKPAAMQTTPAAIQTKPAATVANSTSTVAGNGVQRSDQSDRQLPKTASDLPLIAFFGLVSLAVAFGLMVFSKRSTVAAR